MGNFSLVFWPTATQMILFLWTIQLFIHNRFDSENLNIIYLSALEGLYFTFIPQTALTAGISDLVAGDLCLRHLFWFLFDGERNDQSDSDRPLSAESLNNCGNEWDRKVLGQARSGLWWGNIRFMTTVWLASDELAIISNNKQLQEKAESFS